MPFSFLSLFHDHIEEEGAAGAKALGLDPDFSLVALHDLLYDEEAEADSLTILVSGAVKLAELLEEVGDVFGSDAGASVLD